LSRQLTRLNGDSGRKKCRDPDRPYLRALRYASLLLVEIKPVQLLPSLPPLRQGVIQQVIVLLPMMMLPQVAPFMQQYGVNAAHRCLYQPPGLGEIDPSGYSFPNVSSSIAWPEMGMECPGALREESTRRDVRRIAVWIQETWPPLVKVSCGNDVDVYVCVCSCVSSSLRAPSPRRSGSKPGAGSLLGAWWWA
jgi:hypothetical protein